MPCPLLAVLRLNHKRGSMKTKTNFVIAMAFGLAIIGPNQARAQSTTGIAGLYDATTGSGADIGAKINSLCSTNSAQNPTIEVPAGTYTFSTTLDAGTALCTILGMGKMASILQYTGTGVAEQGYNLHNLQLRGSGGGTGIVLNGPLQIIDNVHLGTASNPFTTGMTVGPNAYLDRVSNSEIEFNTQNFYFPGSQTPHNSGENVVFDHVDFADGATFANCVQIGDFGYDGPQVTFYSPSFDSCQWANYDSAVTMYAPHFEAVSTQNGPYGITSADDFAGFPTNSTTLYNPQLFANAKVNANGLFDVDRYGVLNIEGMVDRTLDGPLAYLDTGTGGQPTLLVIAPDNKRTTSQLYNITSGTTPNLTILTSTVVNLTSTLVNLNTANGLMLNGNLVLPSSLAGTHGTGSELQTSDSSGPNGDLPMYGPDGSLTDSGYGRGSYPTKSGSGQPPHVACWLNGTMLGQCTTQPDATGSCTCQ